MTFPSVIDGYHAGPLDLLKRVASEGVKMIWSTSDREWLGFGTYFWAFSLDAAHRWREIGESKGWWEKDNVGIMRAKLQLGNSLNMFENSGVAIFRQAHEALKRTSEALGYELPQNEKRKNGIPLERRLDCLIFEQAHMIRNLARQTPFDSVICPFELGKKIVPGTSHRDETHIQVAMRNHQYIKSPEIVWPAFTA